MKNNSIDTARTAQVRADFAYRKVIEATEDLSIDSKKYKAYVKKLPMYIKANGLGATLAYIKANTTKESKDTKSYQLIYKQLSEWLRYECKELINVEEDLVKAVISTESPVYRTITNEVLEFLNWWRRFSDGLIEGEATE